MGFSSDTCQHDILGLDAFTFRHMVTSLLNERAIPIFAVFSSCDMFCSQFRTLKREPHFRKWIISHRLPGNTVCRKLHNQFTCLYLTCMWHRCTRFPCNQSIISISGGQGRQKKVCVRMSRDVACFYNHIEGEQDCYQQTNVFWPTRPTVTNGD